MPNRSQRRQMMRQQAAKSKALIESYTRQKRIEGLLHIIKCSYAGIILALQEEFGFDEEQCFRAIQAVDNKTIWSLNYSELADEVLEKTGLELNLDEPFNRILHHESGDNG